MQTLRRTCGIKRKYVLLEDNDPTGYKSNAAIAVKKSLGIATVEFPTYSPDLNPCDYFLWKDIERRMNACQNMRRESREQYLARLKRAALSTSKETVRKGLAQMPARIRAVCDADGAHIAMD